MDPEIPGEVGGYEGIFFFRGGGACSMPTLGNFTT